ncbi:MULTISPECIES: hypothetical protein [Mesorhizobium]|nr:MULTISPECIES: hypothetical protein [Mesorhizobium]
MPKPTVFHIVAENISEFAKCIVVFFVLPPTLTVAAYVLIHLVR